MVWWGMLLARSSRLLLPVISSCHSRNNGLFIRSVIVGTVEPIFSLSRSKDSKSRSGFSKLLLGGSIRTMANKPDKEELKKRLTPFQWHVTQEKGTERPFTGAYNKHYEAGTYTCLVCEQKLFSSEHKYDSGCGWPAFNDVIDQGLVTLKQDTTLNMVRTEVVCANCGSHLGHVFNDGPKPKRRRFCINSTSLNFVPNIPKE